MAQPDPPEFVDVEATLCFVARGLPASDAGWIYHPWLEFMGGDQGAGNVVGSASFRMTAGVRTAINQAKFQRVTETNNVGDILGGLVRVLVRDDAGDVSYDGDTWLEAFCGKIIGKAVVPQGGSDSNNGSDYEYRAVGLGASLDQLPINRGFALASDGITVADPGRCPRFNHLAGGDRSAGTVTVNGAAVYVHNLSGSGNRWTARQVMELILAVFARPVENSYGTPTGWEWSVSDPDGCLNYEVDDLDLHGMTVFQAITLLAGPRRGLTFTVRAVGAACTVLVRSGSATAISVGGFTLPASSVTMTFDVRDNRFIDQPVFTVDTSSVYDIIELIGACPWMAITVDSTQFDEGWTGAEQTVYGTNPTSTLVENVYRRFELQPGWNRASAPNSAVGLRWLRPVETSEAYGENGVTGARAYQATAGQVTAASLDADRMLPCSEGFSTLSIGPRHPPVVIVAQSALSYTDAGWADACGELKWSLEIESRPIALRLNDGQSGADIQGYWTSGKIAVTLGIREWLPLLVSWRRPQEEWPCSVPRIKTVELPHCEQWVVLDGTVKGVDENGLPIRQSGNLVVRDDVPTMRQLLALYRAYFTEPNVSAEITIRGSIDAAAARRPGTMVTTLTTGEAVHQINAVVTRRRFVRVVRDGVPMFDTVYTTERIAPELEAIL